MPCLRADRCTSTQHYRNTIAANRVLGRPHEPLDEYRQPRQPRQRIGGPRLTFHVGANWQTPLVPARRTPADLLHVVRAACADLVEVEERLSHGTPTFFVRGGKSFVMLWPDGHHRETFPQLWAAAPPGAQEELVGSEPERFFRPPYVGTRGWIGVRLDVDLDAAELAALCREAYLHVAPPRLRRDLDKAT